MPSPFPGMDPYLEAPRSWDGFRHSMVIELSAALNAALPKPLYSDIGHRSEVTVRREDDDRDSYYRPDVTVASPDVRPHGSGGTALAEPAFELGGSVAVLEAAEEVEVPYVEVRDMRTGHELLTVIEVLSPTNKRPPGSENRQLYDRKRRDLVEGGVSLVELDLLRTGDRGVLGEAAIAAQAKLPAIPEYVALVTRGFVPLLPTPRASLFPLWLEKSLPAIPIPLVKGEAELPLPLQPVFEAAYDAGPYRRVLDPYPPQPHTPLSDRGDWLAGVLRKATQPGR